MGSNCCKCCRDAVQESEITLADLQDQATDLREMEMEETRNIDLREMEIEETINNDVPTEPEPPSPTLRLSDVLESPRSVSIGLEEEISNTEELPRNIVQYGLSCYIASNIFWSTGSFSEPIQSGFYSAIRDDRLKLFKSIPTLDELRALGDKRLKADVILVDFEEDTKLYRLKQLIFELVKGLNSNPIKNIKKVGSLVVDFYKRPPKTTQSFGSHGFPLLGEFRHGCCRVRAILFKVLADAVNIKSKLIKGCPGDCACVDSYNHMFVVVMHNTVEMMVDLNQSQVELIPMPSNEIFKDPISVAGNGDCHSPLDPNSPMYGYMEQMDHESLSRREPNIATESLQYRQGNVIRKQHTANSSPENPYVRSRERFMLNGDKKPVQEFNDDASRSVGTISESLKQIHFSKEQGENDGIESHDLQENVCNNFPDIHIWNEVLALPMFQNKSLLPNKECDIDFSAFEVGTPVGIGSSAKVFRGKWKGTEVAIKMFLDQEATFENINDFCCEIFIASRIQHPNVIMFHGACTKSPQLSLVIEYAERGSLYHLLYSTEEMKNLSWREKIYMLHDICRGLMCIHQMGIVHRDLKSANCLLSNDWTVKICDFGLSRMMEGKTVNDIVPAGTPEWVAPEVFRNEPFSEKCDIFSFGVIMWELCTLTKPWEGVSKEEVIHSVANDGARLEIPEGPLAKLIEDCWLEEPEKRPSCVEILNYLATCENLLSLNL